MKSKGKELKERICALLLAILLAFSGVLPQAAVTVRAAGGDPTGVEFIISDSAGSLINAPSILVYKTGDEGSAQTVQPNIDQKYIIELEEGAEYSYKITKSGYDEYTGTITPSGTDPDANVISADLTLSAIQVSQTSIVMDAGGTVSFQVENALDGAVYTAESDKTSVASVTKESDTSFKINASVAGKASVTVSNDKGSAPAVISVQVNKIDIGDIYLKVLPDERENQTTITCSLEGIADQAANGEIAFEITRSGDASPVLSKTVTLPDNSVVYTVSTDEYLGGTYTVSAMFQGNDKYLDKEAVSVTGIFTKNVPLKLTEAEKTVTFGDTNWKNPKVPVDADTVKGRALTYHSSNPDLVSVDSNTGDITVHHATSKETGKAVIITVSAAAQNDYIATEALEYKVTVKQKEISSLNQFDSWTNSIERIYSENTALMMEGSLKEDSNYKVVLDAVLDDTDAGEDRGYTVDSRKDYDVKDTAGHADYLLKAGFSDAGSVTTKVTIQKRPVYLTLGNTDVAVQYGRSYDDIKKEIEGKDGLVKLAGNNGNIGIGTDSGYIKQDKPEKLPKATFKAPFNSSDLNVGDIRESIIVPALLDEALKGNPGKNYEYKIEEKKENLANLKVEAQKISDGDILKYIDVTSNDSRIDVRRDSEGNLKEIWVSRDAVLKLGVKPEYQDYYKTVMIQYGENGVTTNATDGGITFTEHTDEVQYINLQDGSVWLQKGPNDSVTRTYSTSGTNDDQKANRFDIVRVDNQSPVIEFTGLKNAGVVKKALSAITFGKFDNKTYVETINISEKDDSGEGSGVREWKYYVWKAGSDITDSDLEEAKVKEKISSLTSADWSTGSGNTITVGSGSSKEEIENNYIVFVRTCDNVSNMDVYVSNGMVIEQEVPVISLTMDEKAYYDGDIPYDLTVSDPGDFLSGLGQIKVTVTCDGKVVAGGKDGASYKNSYTIDLKKDKYSVQDLKDLSYKAIKGMITADKNNSNDVTIKAEVYDNASKSDPDKDADPVVTYEKEVKIDTVNPEIKVTYNHEETENKKYYKIGKDCLMTIEYTERNIEKDPARDGLTFDVIKDGNQFTCTLAELEALGIEWVDKKIEDTQEGTDDKKLTDKRSCKLQLRFAEDGDYTITPHCKDRAGRTEDSSETTTFVIDHTAPVIDVVYTAGGKGFTVSDKDGTESRTYKNQAVNAKITITEKNFWTDKKTFSTDPRQIDFSATKGTETPDGILNYQEIAETGGSWSYNVTAAETNLTFEKDANYTFGFTYRDLAGNKAVYVPHYLTVDKTLPNGSISIDKQSFWDVVWNVITFNIFKNSAYQIDLTSDDYTAGVKSTAYYKTAEPISQAEVEGLAEEKWISGMKFEVAPNEQYVVYERIIDRADNVRFIYPTNGAVADNVKPVISIRNLSSPYKDDVFGDDVTLHVDVADPTSGETYSGLEKVWYTVDATGNVNNSITTTLLDNSQDRKQGNQEWSGNITIPAKDFNSNDVRVQVHALDFSGNEYQSEVVPLKIDITVPTIVVTYDLNNPSNGKYYNATRTATVVVTERNFDESAVQFDITNTDGVQPSISGWSRSGDAGVSDYATNTCTVTFAADGDYTLTLNCTDLAGHRSNYTQVDEFTIDQTVPTISVAYDNNSAANGTYYDKPRTATITVNEHNFNGSEVQAAISASLQSQGISAPGVNGWSTSGDSHTASISFSADGDYSFTINYTDLAGNPATAYTQDKFTVDQTKPEIEIFDIKDKSANNGVVAPGVKYSDVNYDASAVKISIKGPKHSERTVSGTRSSIANGESIKMADFERKESVDDVYTLTAQVTDMAGNVDEKSVMFSVNRFGSNFIFGKSTEAFLDQYYSNEEQDLIVTEINVDTLVHNGISYGLDGELVNLEKGTDYTVKESGNEASWKSYQYTMKASNFEREGLYNITIDSKDRANNEVNNKVKESEIEFVIDKTQPTVVITGVENDGQYRTNSRDIAITVADNVAMDSLDVNVDGKEGTSKSYDAKEILKQNGEIPFSLADSSNWQEIKAIATDAAGNTAETSEIRVLITANLLVQFYRNTPLVVGSSVGLAALAAVLIILISRKKKANRKEAE